MTPERIAQLRKAYKYRGELEDMGPADANDVGEDITEMLDALSQAEANQRIVDLAFKWYDTGSGKDEVAQELALAVLAARKPAEVKP